MSVVNKDMSKETVLNWEEETEMETHLESNVTIAKDLVILQETVRTKELRDNREGMEIVMETEVEIEMVEIEIREESDVTTVKNSVISLETVLMRDKKDQKEEMMVIKETEVVTEEVIEVVTEEEKD